MCKHTEAVGISNIAWSLNALFNFRLQEVTHFNISQGIVTMLKRPGHAILNNFSTDQMVIELTKTPK